MLLGPTGTGKSPLGGQIEKNGIRGKRCFHFDFGHELRSLAERDSAPNGFREKELSFIRNVLEKGVLLENKHFPLAEKIVHHFLYRNEVSEEHMLILNGLPRHVDQAKNMNRIVAVQRLVVLQCEPGEIYKRIEKNTGRDRDGRTDDQFDMVRKKLETFNLRTAPLVKYYSAAGCKIITVNITATTTPQKAYDAFVAAYDVCLS